MNSAIGFTATWHGSFQQKKRADDALDRALDHFPELKQETHQIGDSTLTIWGRGNLDACVHTLPDGCLLALIGSPSGNVDWLSLEEQITRLPRLVDLCLPWDGRFILLHISADGETWSMWNDWLGCIPVYYVEKGSQRIASTLEPAIVNAEQFTQNDFFMPAFVHFVMHGTFLSDWTLYKEMKIVPPDCCTMWKGSDHFNYQLNTVQPTELRWEAGWDQLLEELHYLAKKTISEALKTQPNWVLPLSSGLDSRLIAAVGAEAGTNMQAFAWGPATAKDVVYSKCIAKTLGIPWERVDLGSDYWEKYSSLWGDLFGSSLHFHGMYQIPFYKALEERSPGKVISGFLGDAMAGALVREMDFENFFVDRSPYTTFEGNRFLDCSETERLFKDKIDEELFQIMNEIDFYRARISGSRHQKLMQFNLWARVQRFINFQLSLAHYWRDVEAPYFNRDYARFFYSLPRAYVDGRRLLLEMMKTYYKKVMCVPGTYGNEPAILTGRFLVKRRLDTILPKSISKILLPEFSATQNVTDVTCLRFSGKRALWPTEESLKELGKWFQMDLFDEIYQKATAGDMKSVRVLQCLQTIAYRANPSLSN